MNFFGNLKKNKSRQIRRKLFFFIKKYIFYLNKGCKDKKKFSLLRNEIYLKILFFYLCQFEIVLRIFLMNINLEVKLSIHR